MAIGYGKPVYVLPFGHRATFSKNLFDCRPDVDVACRSLRGRILVISTREDVTMLREVVRVLGGKPEKLL